MERIETIDLKTETDALESGHGITLYTFDEYGRLMHYARIIASTTRERTEEGYANYFLTVFQGGEDLREFQEQDDEDHPDLESAIKRLETIWKGRTIWWEREGVVPGVDDGITFDELHGASMLANARKRLETEMRVRGIEPDGEQAAKDAKTIRQAGLNAIAPSFFELFEDYVVDETGQLDGDGVDLETRMAWMREMYRAMLNTLKE